MTFTYTQSLFWNPSPDIFAENLARLIRENLQIFTEMSAQQGIELVAILPENIVVGAVVKNDPTLIYIEADYVDEPNTGFTAKVLQLQVTIKSGAKGNTVEQYRRACGYRSAIENLIYRLFSPAIDVKELLVGWPANVVGIDQEETMEKRAQIHQHVGIEIRGIQSIPVTPFSNGQNLIAGYECGLRLRLTVICNERR